jgi:hypothetical protein
MTPREDFVGRLESYLDDYEGYTPLPESVRTAVHASLPSVKQTGSEPGPMRFLAMTLQIPAPARYGLVAAALVAAVLLGAFVFADGGGIGGPSDSTEPMSSASPSPAELTSLFDAPQVDGNLLPGRYVLDHDAFPARIEVDVPEGWWYWFPEPRPEDSDTHAILVDSLDTGASNGSAWGLSFTSVGEVREEPCDAGAGMMDPSVTDSAASLAEAFSSWETLPATVEDVTIGGYEGKRVELDTSSSACLSRLFTTPAGFSFEIQRARSDVPAPPEQFTFVDVDGSVLVIWTTDYPGTNYFEIDGGATYDSEAHAEDQVQLRQILDSIVIVPRSGG